MHEAGQFMTISKAMQYQVSSLTQKNFSKIIMIFPSIILSQNIVRIIKGLETFSTKEKWDLQFI